MVYESMPCADYKEIDNESLQGNRCLICFKGNCKWSVKYGVSHNMPLINIELMSNDEIKRTSGEYWECSLKAKTYALRCEIFIH